MITYFVLQKVFNAEGLWRNFLKYLEKIFHDFANLDLKTNAGELENLIARADERIFDHVCKQEGGRFVFRGFPWLRMPDSADLKEKKREFIYNT